MAEWLRRWTRNPLGSSRAGSNPADNDYFFSLKKEINFQRFLTACESVNSLLTSDVANIMDPDQAR